MAQPTPGSYRNLFISALERLQTECNGQKPVEISPEKAKELSDLINHYLPLVKNPNYKFGQLNQSNGYTDFFRS